MRRILKKTYWYLKCLQIALIDVFEIVGIVILFLAFCTVMGWLKGAIL